MENQISSTLFRFVSHRSPKLPDENDLPVKFIEHPDAFHHGVFYDAVSDVNDSKSKRERLIAALPGYKSPYENDQAIKALNADTYPFAQWLVRNRATYTEQELQDALPIAKPLSSGEHEALWMELFYQIITQKSFYTKELVMQLLFADHVARTAKNEVSEEAAAYNAMVMNARVVLPVALFGDYQATVRPTTEPADPTIPVKFSPARRMANKLIEAQASSMVQRLNVLKYELQKSQKAYEKAYRQEYELKYAEYEDEHRDTLKQYNEDRIAAMAAFCAVKDPDTIYNPADPCQQVPAVPYPEIPPFNFTFDPPVTPEKLKLELTPESYNVLVFLTQTKSSSGLMAKGLVIDDESGLDDLELYDEIYDLVDGGTTAAEHEANENTNVDSEDLFEIAPGIRVPIEPQPALNPFEYTLCATVAAGQAIFSLSIGVPDSSWLIEDILVTWENPAGSQVVDYDYLLLASDTQYDLSDIFRYNSPIAPEQPAENFVFTVNFKGGFSKVTAPYNIPLRQSCVTAFATGGDGIVTPPDTSAPFIPSGFGFKEIGIAEYKRVEQTVQCYIEGEVSQIENIMAREYREKATRYLRRSEDTTTSSTESEQEKLTDTTATDRFEMQSEVAKVLQESESFSGFVNTGYQRNGFTLNAGIAYANNSASDNSSVQAVTQAKEVVERALDRVVLKVKQERVRKVIEEYEENNKHGFDNRRGNNHVVGVFRWVDKLYKNQVWNYGIRTIFEFMIPEPARLHTLGMEPARIKQKDALTPPVDPRIASDLYPNKHIPNAASLDAAKAQLWAGIYNADIEVMPKEFISIGDAYNINYTAGAKLAEVEANSGNAKIVLPEGYRAISAVGVFNAVSDNKLNQGALLSLTIGNKTKTYKTNFSAYSLYLDTSSAGSGPVEVTNNNSFADAQFTGELPVSYTLGNHVSGDISVSVKCQLTEEAKSEWRQRTYKAIIDAYEDALAAHQEKLVANQEQLEKTKETNPGFYRQIENVILRKNCISYLIDQNPAAKNTYGKKMNKNTGAATFEDYEVDVNAGLSDYASFVKFMEQAFEWDIMSYNFYPYYWGNRENWNSLYTFNGSDDPVFRSFCQAGMARVVVTVRPGFEDAVALYMATGLLWNAGQMPTLGSALYLSIADELMPRKPSKEGKAWLTRVPTSLTILQAGSIGLEVTKALPCNCEDLSDFEDPAAVPCNPKFTLPIPPIVMDGADNEDVPSE